MMVEESAPQFRTIAAADLWELMRAVLTTSGVSSEDAVLAADALLEASLSGYDSHGVMRLPRYADDLAAGAIAVHGEFRILHETPAVAHVDGGRALGPVTATRAMNLACAKAVAVGVGCVSTNNSNDIGRLGSYVRKPATEGLIAVLVVNDSGGLPSVAPYGGVARFFSTNPLAAGIPTDSTEPIVVDMSTSMVSVGKLKTAAQRGEAVPVGWLIDRTGESVVDPARYFTEPENTTLLPLGGMLAGYKGFALQLLVDVLAGALGGAGVSTGEDPGLEANAIFALAIDPDHFASRDRVTALVGEMVAGLGRTEPLPGVDAVRLPGERAAQERRQRQQHGIPLDIATRRELARVLTKLDLMDTYGTLLQLAA